MNIEDYKKEVTINALEARPYSVQPINLKFAHTNKKGPFTMFVVIVWENVPHAVMLPHVIRVLLVSSLINLDDANNVIVVAKNALALQLSVLLVPMDLLPHLKLMGLVKDVIPIPNMKT